MANNVINAVFSSSTITYTKPAYQYDYGMILKFSGIDLPQAYEVHFSNTEFCGESISQIGDESGVTIPDEMFLSGAPIYAWTFLHTGEDDGETIYKTVISINKRAQPSDIEPTPVQQDVITQAIAALNVAVEQTAADVVASGENAQAAANSAETAGQAKDDAVEAQGKAEDAQEAAETAQGKAEDAQRAAEQAAGSVLGLTADATIDNNVGTPSVEVDVTTEADHKHMEFTFRNLKGVQGDPGDPGIGISSVVLNSDFTLTITLTNGTSYTTSSIRGEVGATPNLTIGTISTLPEGSQATATITGTDEDPVLNLGIPVGDTGDPGISPTITVTEITGGHNVEITDAQGTQDFDVLDGEVSEQDLEDALIDKADVITSSASGEIVTIADGGNDLPVVDLKLSLLPVQDLHGQDAPYPPGGGKNKWSEGSQTFTKYKVCTLANYIPAGSCIFSAIVSTTDTESEYCRVAFFDLNGTQIEYKGIKRATTRTSFVVTLGRDCYSVYLYAGQTANQSEGDTATFTDIMLENGTSTSAASAYAPYENLCPISGWTGVEVTQKNKNLIGGVDVANRIKDKFGENATIDTTAKTVSFVPSPGQGYQSLLYNAKVSSDVIPFPHYYPFKENTRYTFIFKATSTGERFNIGVSYADGTNNGGFTTANYVGNNYVVWTSPANKTVQSFYVGIYSGTTTLYYDTVGVFEGVITLDDFVPYEGTEKYEVDWTDEAGTVYGGSLDVTTGTNESAFGIVDLGTLTWTYRGNGVFISVDVAGYSKRNSDICYCSAYKGVGAGAIANLGDKCIQCGNSYYAAGAINIKDTAYSDAAIFKAAMSGVMLCYELATPVEYTLSENQIATFLGTNNFWSNGNGTLDLEYRADTKLYIEQLTKPTEDDMTANANIASGKFFMIGNRLFLSTTAIAQGEQIVVGTNCSEISLADALNQLNS